MAGTTLRAHNVKGQENLDNLLKLEVYATMVHEFKPLFSCYSTCHIEYLRPVHGALNVDENKN